MAVLPIAKLGNPVLRKIAAQVDPRDIRTKDFQQLIDDMFETMRHNVVEDVLRNSQIRHVSV